MCLIVVPFLSCRLLCCPCVVFAVANMHLTPPCSLVLPDPTDPRKPLVRAFAHHESPVVLCGLPINEDGEDGEDGRSQQAADDAARWQAAFVETLFPQIAAVGKHEVVVQHWRYNTCQALMSAAEINLLWEALAVRYKALARNPGTVYVHLVESHGSWYVPHVLP